MIDKPVQVLVIDADQIVNPAALATLVAAIRELRAGVAPVLVPDPATGASVSSAQRQVLPGVSPHLDGDNIYQTRQTRLARRLAQALAEGQLDPVSLGSTDGVWLRDDGIIPQVNRQMLLRLLRQGTVPVLPPLMMDPSGDPHTVDAAMVAIQVALALEARKLMFVGDVPGIQVAGRVIRAFTLSQVAGLIADGYIVGELLQRVRQAGEAVRAGLHQAVITDPAGLVADRGTAILNG